MNKRHATELLIGTVLLLSVLSGTTPAAQAVAGAALLSDTQANGESLYPVISADGHIVVYYSSATNLVNGDTNNTHDIFVHDRQTGQTSRVSVASDGSQANDASAMPVVSADGRFVAFESLARNLVSGDTNGWDVFVHDRQTGQTTRASVASDGSQANGDSLEPSISADGRFVAFYSRASNLVSEDTNGTWDVFVHDRQTGETTRVSLASDGSEGNDSSEDASISADGSLIAFTSKASNLVSGDTNGLWDVFVHDRQTGQTTRASVASDGSQGFDTFPSISSISADGRFIAFVSIANTLVNGDTNGSTDVFVHDRHTGQTTRASVASDGRQAFVSSGFSANSVISADGRFVVFASLDGTLADDGLNECEGVYVHDMQTGVTTRATVAFDGSSANDCSGGSGVSISADGRFVTFTSHATNLVADDTNNRQDIFVRDVQTGETTRVSVPNNPCIGTVGAMPTPLEYARMADIAHQDKMNNAPPDCWQRLDGPITTSDGYLGLAFVNDTTHQVVFAHGATLLSDLGDLFSDVQIFSCAIPDQHTDAEAFETSVRQEMPSDKQDYGYSHTGHSLGATLAELSAEVDHTSAVTFDSPGSACIAVADDPTVSITTYLGPANFVNTATPHRGIMYEMNPNPQALRDQYFSQLALSLSGLKFSLGDIAKRDFAVETNYIDYTAAAHNLEAIIDQLDPNTGYPKNGVGSLIQQVYWPIGLWPGFINYLLPSPPVGSPLAQLRQDLILAASISDDAVRDILKQYILKPASTALDVVFVVSTGHDMQNYLNAFRSQAQPIVNALLNHEPNANVAIVTYGDQGSPQTLLNFTGDTSTIVNAINTITVGSGDASGGLAALNAALDFNWHDGAQRAIFLLTDTPPQDPDPLTGITEEQILEHSFGQDPVFIYPVVVDPDSSALDAFQTLATGSFGSPYLATSTDNVTDAIFQSIPNLGIPLIDPAMLASAVTLQGRPAAPDVRWEIPLHVVVTPQGGGAAVFDGEVTTDENGQFELNALTPGDYRLWVKGSHMLAVAQDVTVVAGENTVTVGVLREGDTDGNNLVNLTDFSLLAATFGKQVGDGGYDERADFNGDGIVNLLDFSLLATNFGQAGAS